MITFREIWNKAAESQHGQKEFKKRDYLYASELGGSVYDIWHKMNAVPPTNPPNARAIRKFNAGHTWEWFVKLVLWQAGVLRHDQKSVRLEADNNMPAVSGRIDFELAPNQKRAGLLDLPEFMQHIAANFQEREFDPTILEIKSVSSMMFPVREREASMSHLMQAGTYSRVLSMPALVTYISKDDCLLAEHVATNTSDLEACVDAFRALVGGYLSANEKPPLEPLIIREDGKYSKNWKVEYSSYLDHYGFSEPDEYREEVTGKIARWNRVLKRIEEGAKLTDDNKSALEEMNKYFEHGKES